MSAFAAFRRQPVPQQIAQNLQTITIPAPTRGLIQSENEAFMQPGGAQVQINWASTMKGCKLRGGTSRWCDLHRLDNPVWANSTAYAINNLRYDPDEWTTWRALVAHTSAAGPTKFAADRAANPTFWAAEPMTRLPVISAFEYASGNVQRMYAGQATKLFDVTINTPVLIKSGQGSGNYCAVQFANLADDYMLVLNAAGDFVLRTGDGVTFTTLSGVAGPAGDGITNITYDPTKIPPGVVQGRGLVYAWKYRNRLYFIQQDSMNAWFLPIDAVGGVLQPITLGGAASRGGKLLFGATWSIDAGDGIDDKCVFVTDLGEVLIFTGSNPADAANWRQEGRYQIGAPLGMNAHMQLGGDLMIATVDGIVPLSQAINKDSGALDLAMITHPIKPLWRTEVELKREWAWSMKRWDEYGAAFVATPGGETPSTTHCLGVNNATGAWFVFTYDATAFLRMRADMFFGDQRGIILQADRTGFDDARPGVIDGVPQTIGVPYVATLVGGWELFQSGAAQVVWHQARAVFTSGAAEPFVPQLTATVDYVVTIPQPPPPGEDPLPLDVWDEGTWDTLRWDIPKPGKPPARNTMWMSIGMTGFAHAPIVQVTLAQQARPSVELIAISTTQERGGINV
jgi:hypothetical protein